MQVSLIQAPFALGRADVEVATGPIRILEAGAAEALRAAGHDVEVETVEVVEGDEEDYWNEIEGSFAVVRGVAGGVRGAIARGSFPVVLAGNCLNSVGVVAGTSAALGVVWFDAHGDFSTTEKSLSGFLDGMGLSILTGTGWDALRETVPGYRAVPEEHVVHVGMRDAWDHELERLRAIRDLGRPAGRDRGRARTSDSMPCASALLTSISTSTWMSSTAAKEW